jgi:hypothetical protein
VITTSDLDAALMIARGCPGLKDPEFGVEVGIVEEVS